MRKYKKYNTNIFIIVATTSAAVAADIHYGDQACKGDDSQVQGDQVYMAVFFWYLVKPLVQCTRVLLRSLDKSLFTRHQNDTAIRVYRNLVKLGRSLQ